MFLVFLGIMYALTLNKYIVVVHAALYIQSLVYNCMKRCFPNPNGLLSVAALLLDYNKISIYIYNER